MKTRIVQNEPNNPTGVSATQTRSAETTAAPAAGRNAFRDFVRRRELVIFFVLCYLIGWSALPWGTSLP